MTNKISYDFYAYLSEPEDDLAGPNYLIRGFGTVIPELQCRSDLEVNSESMVLSADKNKEKRSYTYFKKDEQEIQMNSDVNKFLSPLLEEIKRHKNLVARVPRPLSDNEIIAFEDYERDGYSEQEFRKLRKIPSLIDEIPRYIKKPFGLNIPENMYVSLSTASWVTHFSVITSILIPVRTVWKQSTISKLESNTNILNLLMRYLISGCNPNAKNFNRFHFENFLFRDGNIETDIVPCYFADKSTLVFHVPLDFSKSIAQSFADRIELVKKALAILGELESDIPTGIEIVKNSFTISNLKTKLFNSTERKVVKDLNDLNLKKINHLSRKLSFLFTGYEGPKKAVVPY